MRKMKPKSRENRLTTEEIERMKANCKYLEEKVVVYGLLYTGMRISEFIHMRRDWVDWKEGIIHVPFKQRCNCYECMAKKGDHKGFFKCKTKHGERPIPLLDELRPVLKECFGEYLAIMELVENRINAWRIVRNVAKRARISHPCFPHCLRSSFASIMAEKGFDAFTIQSVLGWKDISISEMYVKMSGTSVRDKFKELWK